MILSKIAEIDIEEDIWAGMLRKSREEMEQIRKLPGSFTDNMKRIVVKDFIDRYPQQNAVYNLKNMSKKMISHVAAYYGDEVLNVVIETLTEKGFIFPDVEVKQANRRSYYIVIEPSVFNSAESPIDLLDYIDEFLYDNVPHTIGDKEYSPYNQEWVKHVSDRDAELESSLSGFKSRFSGEDKPRLVCDVTITDTRIVERSKFDLVKSALCLYYKLFYDARSYNKTSLLISGAVYEFAYFGLPLQDILVYDIDIFEQAANECVRYCDGLDEYSYVNFNDNVLVESIDMTNIRDESVTYTLPSERVDLFHNIWDRVLDIKSRGHVPLLSFSGEMNKMEQLIAISMVFLENVRIGLEPRGDIGRFIDEISMLSKKCNMFAEDRIKYVLNSIDSFFTMSNRELFFGTKVPNEDNKELDAFLHIAPIEIGYVLISFDKEAGFYKVVSEKEQVLNCDIINDRKFTIVSYKDLSGITMVDSFAGMKGKEGKSFSLDLKSNDLLCQLLWEYEKVIVDTEVEGYYEKLKPYEFLSLRNCFFMEYEGQLCVARILEFESKMEVSHTRFMYFNKVMSGEISEDDLNSYAFIEHDVSEDKMYQICMPLTMLADYDGVGSVLVLDSTTEEPLRMRLNPYINMDGIAGIFLLLQSTGKYTRRIMEDIFSCSAKGLDAVAIGKFDLNSNFVYQTTDIFKHLTRDHLRKLGYLNCYGGDNIIWKDGYVIGTDTFKREV